MDGPRRLYRNDADGWLNEETAYVKSVRVSFAPGAPLCELTEDDSGEPGYTLLAGEREIVIHADEEDAWDHTTRAPLTLLNELLIAHGSAERAYAMGQGNDLAIVFATPEMTQLLGGLHDTSTSR